MNQISKVSIIGLGYIGLPTAAVLASNGVQVSGFDVNEAVVASVNAGQIHIVEPELDDFVASCVADGSLYASCELQPAHAFVVAVPTPINEQDKAPDIGYIEAAMNSLAPVLEPGNLVVLESTSPVGTTEVMAGWLSKLRPDLSFPQDAGEESDIRIAYCPERVLPGSAMRELTENDRVIGGMTPKCAQSAKLLYETFCTGECILTNARTAEMVKLTENSSRDVNIAFANELSVICDEQGINVWELIALANHHPRVNILKPGPGVGGHCIAIDPWFIVNCSPESAKLIATARQVNDSKPIWVLEQIGNAIRTFLMQHSDRDEETLMLACYGITFKPNIDDMRESPALQIVEKLVETTKAKIAVVEPNVSRLPPSLHNVQHVQEAGAMKHADIHVFLVAHSEFGSDIPAACPDGMMLDYCGVFGQNTR